MVYVVSLPIELLADIDGELRIAQRLTKALPNTVVAQVSGPRLALVVAQAHTPSGLRHSLAWVGAALRRNTVGSVDKSITIDPLRAVTEYLPLDGLLDHVDEIARMAFEEALRSGEVSLLPTLAWDALYMAIAREYPSLVSLIDWLIAQIDPPTLHNDSAADRSWQEQLDGLRTVVRLADFPLSAFAAWQRPQSRDAPYLAGLLADPFEQSMIEHDVRAWHNDSPLFDAWQRDDRLRCDVEVLHDGSGRLLEIANVNATPVEGRLGTDVIYYNAPTHSFVLVQYKRLMYKGDHIAVDPRLLSQLDRLEAVAKLSTEPSRPHDWRLGTDSCFLKLAYWPEGGQRTNELTPGMYLPLSYTRMLLADDCTKGRGQSRLLGYGTVERYLVGSQFVQLVKNGLAGTVGTTIEQLRDFGRQRTEEGSSLVLAVEHADETVRDRHRRVNRRGVKRKKK